MHMPVFVLSLRVFLLPSVESTITDGVDQILQNSIRNIEEDIIAMEKFIHTACDKTIPNYRQSTTRKPTGKSIWNNNIAEAISIISTFFNMFLHVEIL
jgi:uncharacterized protein (UPF0248 family)